MKATRLWIVLGLATVVTAGLGVGAHLELFDASDPATLRLLIDRVRALPHLRLSFVCLYTVAGASGVPATPMTLAGGVLFGPVQGMILNWLSDMLAATVAFGMTRLLTESFGRPVVKDRQVPQARGFLGLLRLRVIPVVPFSVLNYGSAVYGMRWRSFLAATAIGVIPATVVYTLFASSLVDGVAGAGRRALMTAGLCAVGVIGLSLLPRLVWPGSSGPSQHV